MIETSDHVIISLYLDRDPGNYWVEADDRLGPMVQARSDLAAGEPPAAVPRLVAGSPVGRPKTMKTP